MGIVFSPLAFRTRCPRYKRLRFLPVKTKWPFFRLTRLLFIECQLFRKQSHQFSTFLALQIAPISLLDSPSLDNAVLDRKQLERLARRIGEKQGAEKHVAERNNAERK